MCQSVDVNADIHTDLDLDLDVNPRAASDDAPAASAVPDAPFFRLLPAVAEPFFDPDASVGRMEASLAAAAAEAAVSLM